MQNRAGWMQEDVPVPEDEVWELPPGAFKRGSGPG
jgi:hypothetical protein